jgi:hypothetical protein
MPATLDDAIAGLASATARTTALTQAVNVRKQALDDAAEGAASSAEAARDASDEARGYAEALSALVADQQEAINVLTARVTALEAALAIPPTTLTLSDGTPIQLSDRSYLELAA